MWISFLFLWERVLLSARTESNQWPRPPSLAPSGQFTLRCTKGASFDEHMACASVHRRRPPGPPIYGGVSLWPLCNPRRAKSRPVSVLFSAHRGLLPSKFEGIYILTHTAWCVPTCLVRRWSGGPAATALPRQAVSVQRRHFQISDPVGACVPEARRTKWSCLSPPDGFCPTINRASPVAGGPGVRDYEHPPLARCSSERNPRGIFGSFLGKQKGTRPAGRNPLKTHKKETHNAERR